MRVLVDVYVAAGIVHVAEKEGVLIQQNMKFLECASATSLIPNQAISLTYVHMFQKVINSTVVP